MSDDRDLAEAIYTEIVAPASVDHALDVWRLSYQPGWAASDLVRHVLEVAAATAINTVLARRLSEAARTGPWEGPQEEPGYPGSLLPPGWPKRGTP